MSAIRFINNTTYKIPSQEMFESIRHFLLAVPTEKIESVELTNEKLTVFGIDCALLEQSVSKSLPVSGVIRWFDESSGDGSIRLSSGKSCYFYSCNVIGADSMYPHLVTNVQFKEGDKVECLISSDPFIVEQCGLTSIVRKVV